MDRDRTVQCFAQKPYRQGNAYFVNQYPKLEAIFDDGRIELDNHLIENAIRPMAIGRKNYLFCGSHRAAQNAAMLYSFFGSCKMQNINPREWLEGTLQRTPDHSIQRLEELLPGYQGKTTVYSCSDAYCYRLGNLDCSGDLQIKIHHRHQQRDGARNPI